MTAIDPADALRLIERAVLELQSRYSPGRPCFLALENLHSTARRARQEVAREGGRSGALECS